MKTKLNLSALVLLTIAHVAPAHAMLARLSQAAVRAGTLSSTRSVVSDTNSQPLSSLQDFRSARLRLLARTLATQHHESSSEDHSDKSHERQNNGKRALWGLGLLSGATLAAYTKEDFFEPKVAHADEISSKNLWILTAALVIGVGSYYYLDNLEWRDISLISALKKDPARTLEGMIHNNNSLHYALTYDSFLNGRKEISKEMVDEFKRLITSYRYYLITECTECELSRLRYPSYRKDFEDQVVTTLVNKLNRSERRVQYVSFGSGGTFQDLVILANALSQKPDASLAVHLIDPQYQTIYDCRKQLNLPHAIGSEESIDIEFSKTALDFFRAHNANFENWSDERIQYFMQGIYLHQMQSKKELLRVLQEGFPNAQITLYVHTNEEKYRKYIESTNTPYPDVIAAADVEGGRVKDGTCVYWEKEYTQFCGVCLFKNPTLYNLCLYKENRTSYLLRISLNEKNEPVKSFKRSPWGLTEALSDCSHRVFGL